MLINLMIKKKMKRIFLVGSLLILAGCQTNAPIHSNSDSNSNYNAELEALHKRAASGNINAQHRLCYNYSYGKEGLPKDDAKSFLWCKTAAEYGGSSSLTLYAEKYYFGIGVPVNYQTAFRLYKRAAKKGHRHAQYMIAKLYLYGFIGEPDKKSGMAWLTKSAEQEHEAAISLLKKLKLQQQRN